ncbi:phage major capsid protein [Bradyrhizobium sp. CCGUVB23]|uniref:phage major capsid protein n=1 Tax=Bradyrhizobium sp. CCGUVB23 TaxID=2949630 RepID=UPI0020B3CEBF|nr:phage major capsid protein [Bradyrhizobium sp. CCGUVB23]MCP3462534.1 phage major capsid protein [Bradyrhizobium sp. CCGUVB23]
MLNAAEAGILRELQEAFDRGDAATQARLAALESSIDNLFVRAGRPGHAADNDNIDQRKSAIEYCLLRRELLTPKIEGDVVVDYVPSHDEINQATLARKAIRNLFRRRDPNLLDAQERKSLSSFAFGASNSFILPPELSGRVLSCLVTQTDVTALVGSQAISGPSLKLPLDNVVLDVAGFACEASCWANNPNPDFSGLGEIEIKPESLRYVVCAPSDLLADSSFNIEAWVLGKVATAFRDRLSASIMTGTGIGMPQGILHPNSGIPVCETSENTPAGTFTWQDLVMLMAQVPMQWQGGARFWMNQKTFSMLLSMSSTDGRPLLNPTFQSVPGFNFMGVPIDINNFMPDIAPGATPIAYGNWNAAYLLVRRSGVTMLADPYSAGWCVLFRFDTRVGGGILCPNAARLLRIR